MEEMVEKRYMMISVKICLLDCQQPDKEKSVFSTASKSIKTLIYLCWICIRRRTVCAVKDGDEAKGISFTIFHLE